MSKLITFGSLFAGIGGFDLGFERAGMQCKWQVEIDDYATKVLEKHWPNVNRERDIRECGKHNLERVDVICGGFPCQGISAANHRGKGIDDERSGLWTDYHRLLSDLRPKLAVVENTAAITFRGLGTVLGDISECGYDASWRSLPAKDFGAPHGRNRIFIVAHLPSIGFDPDEVFRGGPFETAKEKQAARIRFWPGERKRSPALHDRIRWCPHGELLRMVDGIPDGLDRYRGLGNAVVPQVAEWIGRRIVEALEASENVI